ncbi:MAG: hypothetical protein GXO61_02595 [Epsilonproteobacteria bacterium]|nr:hypothetical protein [Campylobacterota bacterium]
MVEILDSLKLPFEIPPLLHSPVVHFAIVLPLLALVLEIVNLFLRRRCIGVISSLLLLLSVVVYLGAFFTGKVDGSEAYALLNNDGKALLKSHKTLGIYLVYGIMGIFFLKLLTAALNNTLARLFFVLALAGFSGFALKQGKDGGELVFKYGANVKAVSVLDDKVMELEEKLEECKVSPETNSTISQ